MALVTYNNNSISAVTSASSIPSGALTHIKTLTASSSSTLSFVDGSSDVVLDSTYPIYKFEFINIHPSATSTFQFNMSIDGGSTYAVTKTTTAFRAFHTESDSGSGLGYVAGIDLAQSTAFQDLATDSSGTDNDSGISGTLQLFNPSSTTYVKHFMSNTNSVKTDSEAKNIYIAGYGNTTSSIDAVRFQMSSGNIDAGTIKLYGIKDS